MDIKEIEESLSLLIEPGYKERLEGYFKTAPGEYGEGDEFLGIRIPTLRKEIKTYKYLSIDEMGTLLSSKYHEVRLLSLLLLVNRFQMKKTTDTERQQIYVVYLKHIHHINNWDLVDSSAHYIVGPWLETRDRQMLYSLVKSDLLWERRIAIMSCFHFISIGQFDDALALALLVIDDKEDLIHKASGWMLREIGNKNRAIEEAFLQEHYHSMPRTMLRYAIEKFPEELRQQYLKGTI